MVYLGDRDIVLEREHVVLLPKRLDQWLRQPGVRVAYTAIVDAHLVGAERLSRGRWMILLRDHTRLTVAFPRRAACRTEAVHHEVLVRALSAELARR